MRVIELPLPIGEIERVAHVAAMVSPHWRLLPVSGPVSGAGVFLIALLRVAEEHAMERLRDGAMEVDVARDENRLVHQTLAEGVWMLYDGVSEADRAVVVEVNRAETFRDLVVA